MKIISFSLWGHDPKYLVGAIKNADLAKDIYPEWTCRYYVARDNTPGTIISELQSRDNTEVILRDTWGNWSSMFWRFEPAAESDVEIMISRDCDSRLNTRERMAVQEWEDSDLGFHIMRDHPWHRYAILGGMWGAKKGTIPEIGTLMSSFSKDESYGIDYKFFNDIIFPKIRANCLTHDEFFGDFFSTVDVREFPFKREKDNFVGKVFDENDETVLEHLEPLRKYYEK